MLYLICNDRIPKDTCSFCSTALRECPSYTRDLNNGLTYCTPQCYKADVYATARRRGALVALPKHIPIKGGKS